MGRIRYSSERCAKDERLCTPIAPTQIIFQNETIWDSTSPQYIPQSYSFWEGKRRELNAYKIRRLLGGFSIPFWKG